MKVEVKITKEILEASKFCGIKPDQKDNVGQNCAIGLAIVNLFGKKSWVSGHEIIIYKKDFPNIDAEEVERIKLPYEAWDFIIRFDKLLHTARVKMQPFSFEIDVPDNVIDLIGIDKAKEIINNTETLALV